MIRAEEILKAARDYVDGVIFSSPSDVIHFENGAKWADEHPNLESLWHDASEEPKKGEDIIALDIDGISVSGIYKDYNGNGIYRYHCFLCEWDAVVKWAYTSDLLPKGGER